MDVDLRGDYCGAGTNPTNSVAGDTMLTMMIIVDLLTDPACVQGVFLCKY